MTPEQLFLDTLDDLEKRVAGNATEYQVLGISPLLRKLLLDERPLVDQVNRRYKKQVRFRVNVEEPHWKAIRKIIPDFPEADFWSQEDGFDPETAMSSIVAELRLADMLKCVPIITEGHECTVKDLIQHAANVQGGVHLGTPSTPREEALDRLARSIQIGGYAGGLRILRAIGRVVIKGLEPLRSALKAEG